MFTHYKIQFNRTIIPFLNHPVTTFHQIRTCRIITNISTPFWIILCLTQFQIKKVEILFAFICRLPSYSFIMFPTISEKRKKHYGCNLFTKQCGYPDRAHEDLLLFLCHIRHMNCCQQCDLIFIHQILKWLNQIIESQISCCISTGKTIFRSNYIQTV